MSRSPFTNAFLLLLFLAPPFIYAHAALVQSSPAPGEQLTTPPNEIRLKFNETLTAESTIFLFTANFQTISGLTTHLDPTDPTVVVAALPRLMPNQYTVQWTAVSADGHQITGSYSFTLVENSMPKPETLLVVLLILLALAVVVRAVSRLHPPGRE